MIFESFVTKFKILKFDMCRGYWDREEHSDDKQSRVHGISGFLLESMTLNEFMGCTKYCIISKLNKLDRLVGMGSNGQKMLVNVLLTNYPDHCC